MELIETQIVSIDKVRPNDWNPNHMTDPVFTFLKKNIERRGFYQDLAVIRDPNSSDEYIIFDGEHRYRAALEGGATEISVKVLNLSLSEAKAETINANRIRGSFDPIELGELITDIKADPFLEIPLTELLVIPEVELELLADLSASLNPDNDGREEIKKVQKNFSLNVRFENKKDLDRAKEVVNLLLARDEGVCMPGTILLRSLEWTLAGGQ